MNEPWAASSIRPRSLDSRNRPSLGNSSTHFVDLQSCMFDTTLEDYQPPPPLTGDPGSPGSSTWSLPWGTDLALIHRHKPHSTSSLSAPSTPCDAIGHFDAPWQYTNEEQDGVVLRKGGRMLNSYRPRSSLGDLKSIRYPNRELEKDRGRHSFKEYFDAPQEKARARSCEGERGWNRRYGRVDIERTQWEMSRLIGFATSTCVEDWEGIKAICDRVNQSDSEAKEACKALRRDIKFGLPTTQLSASRLWAILMQNCAQYFVAHTTNRNFLGVIENVVLSPATTSVVRDRLVEVVGTSVYLLKDSRNVKSYQSTWRKLRLQLKLIYSPEGLKTPVDDTFWNFSPPKSMASSPTELGHPSVKETSDLQEGSTVQRLFEECKAVVNNCRILRDMFSTANPGSVVSDPQIQAFREKCSNFQSVVGPRIDWAIELANRARTRQGFLSGSSQITGTTIQEQLVEALFNVNEEIDDVFKIYDDLVQISESPQPPPYTLPAPDMGGPFVVGPGDTTSAPSPTSPTTVSDTSVMDQDQSTSTSALETTNYHDASIGRKMAAREVVSHLVAHGCRDLSGELELSSFDEYPTSHGGLSDIYAGRLLNGTRIAVKALRVSTTSMKHDPTHLKHAARELHTWGRCTHPNVLHLMGLSIFRGRIGMVSLWMKYGSLPSYLESVPGVDRFDMCVQICEALSYLHRIGIVHGDLKGANVLVSEGGVPVLTDFGNSLLADRTLRFTQTTSSPSFTVRWSAPEIIEESTSHTEASDIYALGMTIYETLTGKVPYHGKNESNVIRLVTVTKQHPERLKFVLNNDRGAENLWDLLVRCWSYEPALRPSAVEMTNNPKDRIKLDDEMEQVIALLDYNATEPGELSFKKGETLTVLDRKYEHWWLCKSANSMFGVVPCNHVKPSNHSRTRFVSIESAKRPVIRRQSTPISRNMAAREVVSQLVAHGCQDLTGRLAISSFSEYPAFHVAVKALRVSVESISQDLKHLKHAARELHTWSRCRHPNVIPLLGLAIFRDRIGMVSPWMAYGNLPRYLASEPGVNRLNMCIQICEGLSYLHEIQIIHCDLKGANVLVSDEGVPILTDFGNSSLTDRTLGFTETTSSPSFTVRWSAAEIIEEKTSHTEASDVYALGMTIYETMTGQVPYQGKSESNVILLVTVKKELPDRPEVMPNEVGISDELWELLVVCCSFEPVARPSAAEVVEVMREISVNQERAKVRRREPTEHQERKRVHGPEVQGGGEVAPPNKGSQMIKEEMPSETNAMVEDNLVNAMAVVVENEEEKKLPVQAELQAQVEIRVIEEQLARERGHAGEVRRRRKKQRAEETGRREAGGHREREKQKARRVPVLVTLAHSPTRNLSALDAWNSYEESWSALSTASSNPTIGFYDIPWPLFRVPLDPESITTQAVGEFILFPYHSRDKSRKERLRNAMLRWQPDKFEEQLMPRIEEADRSKVRKAVAAITHSLTELSITSAVSSVGSESLTMCEPTPGNVYN